MTLLDPKHYPKLKGYLKRIDFNSLFAQAVIDHSVRGSVYVDNTDDPRTFYILHGYGMSLLGGDYSNQEFNSAFRKYVLNADKKRSEIEWMQVYPESWNSVMKELFAGLIISSGEQASTQVKANVELNTRVNFKFDKILFDEHRLRQKNMDPRIRIMENTAGVYNEMSGSVIPKAFWNSIEDFIQNGVGFGLYYDGKLVSTAFSSFRAPGKLELGIETAKEFHGKRFGELVCTALLEYCIEQNLEPVWACRLENAGSYKLAQKLGFVPSLNLPYYKLGV